MGVSHTMAASGLEIRLGTLVQARGRYGDVCCRRRAVRHCRSALISGESKTISELVEHLIAKVRVRVEHPFRVIKRQFGHRKVRYRGLAKNDAQLNVLFALPNLGGVGDGSIRADVANRL